MYCKGHGGFSGNNCIFVWLTRTLSGVSYTTNFDWILDDAQAGLKYLKVHRYTISTVAVGGGETQINDLNVTNNLLRITSVAICSPHARTYLPGTSETNFSCTIDLKSLVVNENFIRTSCKWVLNIMTVSSPMFRYPKR